MRLWSLHPSYLDSKGLVALWRESLLAQKVLFGESKGYRHHPQLLRFQEQIDPTVAIASYLDFIQKEAVSRGYKFDPLKIRAAPSQLSISVTKGQVVFEASHLREKLKLRAPHLLAQLPKGDLKVHPIFLAIPGEIEAWEILKS